MMEGTRSQEQAPHKHQTISHSSKFTARDYGRTSNQVNNQLETYHQSKDQYQQLLPF